MINLFRRPAALHRNADIIQFLYQLKNYFPVMLKNISVTKIFMKLFIILVRGHCYFKKINRIKKYHNKYSPCIGRFFYNVATFEQQFSYKILFFMHRYLLL